MNIKECAKINNIEFHAPFGKKYFEIQFDDNNVERVYLRIDNDLLWSRVFVVNDNAIF